MHVHAFVYTGCLLIAVVVGKKGRGLLNCCHRGESVLPAPKASPKTFMDVRIRSLQADGNSMRMMTGAREQSAGSMSGLVIEVR